ncbi:unnamed protein product [Callosobruchus maculatus]|uniref:Reverse transcriptase domain-containing protein n=1 Tax=Callosobruchus maculatus TaxID=64391 RepID=A0A653BRI6_CALMS|nr:unnamed protein product [Callosobruchus maculatus]
MLRVPYTGHRTNISILDELGNPKILSSIVLTRMLTFFRHIYRSDNMEKLVVQGHAPSGWRCGHSPTLWVDTTKQLLDMSLLLAKFTEYIQAFGININNNMSWHDHVVSIAKTASQKLGVLFRCRKLYTPEQLLLLYKAQIRPSLEYCSHMWVCAPKCTLRLLDTIQKRVIRLIDTPYLTKDLHTQEHRKRVADLSLFYRFYHGRCSSELFQILTPKAVRMRNTREALRAHPYQVEVPTPRTSLLQHSFLWRTLTLLNQLPGNLFSEGYNLQRFKSNIHRLLSSLSASTMPQAFRPCGSLTIKKRRTGREKEIVDIIKKRKLEYLGHIMRGKKYELLQLIVEGKVQGKRHETKRKSTSTHFRRSVCLSKNANRQTDAQTDRQTDRRK